MAQQSLLVVRLVVIQCRHFDALDQDSDTLTSTHYFPKIRLVPLTVAAISLFITYFFAAYVLKVVTFAPAVLLAAAVAISADYSLFILRRFRDEERIPLHSCVLAKPIQNVMKESQQSAPIEVSLLCPLSKAHISNSIHTTMNTAGRIVAVSGLVLVCWFTSLVVCFVLLAIVFKSIVLPLRTVATIFISHFVVFGIATFIFQHAATLFGWARPMFKEVDSIFFFVLVFGCTLVFGLALDYDLLLTFSVQECKKNSREAWRGTQDRYFDCCTRTKDGASENEPLLKDSLPPPPEVSTHAAITHAIVSQTGTITSAGPVMTVAFAGLLASNVVAIVEMGLVLVISVLFDTFIVRLFLVPALFSLLGSLNWFPSRL
ncbi:putative MmpL efflux pump [Blattamonas nauphoetae]|uniref:MmpL efflux pump n=1 Tax=Blattamonas nauphoetae TaxID=2049346 RepID=A0ABQ9XIM5_9EUKA|nr:putative MmpL efflux pump [Blattamonas nauphoetae]